MDPDLFYHNPEYVLGKIIAKTENAHHYNHSALAISLRPASASLSPTQGGDSEAKYTGDCYGDDMRGSQGQHSRPPDPPTPPPRRNMAEVSRARSEGQAVHETK